MFVRVYFLWFTNRKGRYAFKRFIDPCDVDNLLNERNVFAHKRDI